MTIERVGQLDPLQNTNKTNRSPKTASVRGSDSISLSSEAREKGEVFRAFEMAKATPDIRADRIAELKAKINDPAYINDSVVSMTAERIVDQLFG